MATERLVRLQAKLLTRARVLRVEGDRALARRWAMAELRDGLMETEQLVDTAGDRS